MYSTQSQTTRLFSIYIYSHGNYTQFINKFYVLVVVVKCVFLKNLINSQSALF